MGKSHVTAAHLNARTLTNSETDVVATQLAPSAPFAVVPFIRPAILKRIDTAICMLLAAILGRTERTGRHGRNQHGSDQCARRATGSATALCVVVEPSHACASGFEISIKRTASGRPRARHFSLRYC
eukprot:6205000-Pleurochrysis_carterae.AAC.1